MPQCVFQHMEIVLQNWMLFMEYLRIWYPINCLLTVLLQLSNLIPIGQQPMANNRQIKCICITYDTHFRFTDQKALKSHVITSRAMSDMKCK